ncbi:MAG: glycoside hydrolase family 38 C-terminal domain-containing protein, partial [Armatimonadota bacterium]
MDPLFAPRVRTELTRSVDAAGNWLRRAACQFDFARAFAALVDRESDWLPTIAAAESLVQRVDPASGPASMEAAVRAAEELLAEIGVEAKHYSIHCVGHGHIDMNWMWSWPETTSTTHDTFASVLALMREYPDLTYSQSQASVYALIERFHPEMFEEIRARVAEGRWEVTAAHWVEGEKNYASGESLVRHLLHTRRWIAEKFGLSPTDVPIDWEPDQFGHANTIPAILSRAGVRFYYACRLGEGFDHAVTGVFPRPRLFHWQAPDGSRVLVNKESTWYNSYVNIGDNIALPAVAFWQETRLRDWMNVFGIGNHGGGPTRVEIDYLVSMREWPIYPTVQFGTAKGWYEKVESEGLDHLPVLDHELNFEFTGCYTSQSLIKQANRFGENQCVEADALTLVSGLDRRERLREAWINVLFNQFHDILPGSGVRQTREHATALFQETAAIAGAAKRDAGKRLAAGVDTWSLLPDTPEAREEKALGSGANTPFVAGAGIGAMETGFSKSNGGGRRFLPYLVWNGCDHVRDDTVVVRLYDTPFEASRIVARDSEGRSHPTHFVGRGNDWGHAYIDVLFLARDVPAFGYATYVLCEGVADHLPPTLSVATRDIIETPFLSIAPDRYSGALTITDLRVPGATHTVGDWKFVEERPRGMTAWVLGGTPDGARNLISTGYHVDGVQRNQGTYHPQGAGFACRIHQHLRVAGTESTVRLTTLVHGLAPRVEVTAEIDWREIGSQNRGIPGLFIENRTGLMPASVHARYETPFGSVVRTGFEGEEVPSMRYAHLDGPVSGGAPAGVTLLNDCKYGHAVSGADLTLRM